MTAGRPLTAAQYDFIRATAYDLGLWFGMDSGHTAALLFRLEDAVEATVGHTDPKPRPRKMPNGMPDLWMMWHRLAGAWVVRDGADLEWADVLTGAGWTCHRWDAGDGYASRLVWDEPHVERMI